MNEERIEELAVQAGAYWKEGYVLQSNGDYVWRDRANINHCDMDINLFAGLIAKDCANIAMLLHFSTSPEDYESLDPYDRGTDDTASAISGRIKTTFGVK